MAFRMAMTDTPTSPNTASHMVEMPIMGRAKIMMTIFTASANTMFCFTMRKVLRAMPMARAMF